MNQTKRSHGSQLPDNNEIREIIEKEAKRPLAPGKEHLHFVSFDTFFPILEHYNEDQELFKRELSLDDVVDEEVNALGRSLIERLAKKILEDENPPLELLNAFYDYLAVHENPQPSDLMFVFGSETLFRIEHAAKLFLQGLAPKILVSGKSPNYMENKESEAVILSRHAQGFGVPKEAFILEEHSITMTDNVRRSLNLLDEIAFPFSSILLVNSPYSQRRGYALFQKYLPDSISVSITNAPTRLEYKREEWYKFDIGTKVILNEALKLKISVAFNTA